jgi:hypothetical protein
MRKSFICIALLALCAGAGAEVSRTQVAFSDPNREGELHVSLVMGNILVRGKDVKQVAIETGSRGEGPRGPDPQEAMGLHRLPQQPSLTIEEQNNVMSISSHGFARPVDLVIEVPTRTRLKLSTVNDGDIHVEGVDGELEIGNVNGSINLTAVSGSVVAHTVNGKILAKLARVAPQKPMSFTSLNGSVDVMLPPSINANLKLRTDNGSVFTDFDLKMLPQSSSATIEDTRRSEGGRYRIEVNKAIYGTVNGGGPEIELRTFNGNIYVRKGS